MQINRCLDCGLDVATTKTRKGTEVVCDVWWDGEYRIYIKNEQPIPHKCAPKPRKRRKYVE